MRGLGVGLSGRRLRSIFRSGYSIDDRLEIRDFEVRHNAIPDGREVNVAPGIETMAGSGVNEWSQCIQDGDASPPDLLATGLDPDRVRETSSGVGLGKLRMSSGWTLKPWGRQMNSNFVLLQ